jgi:hypothetical protein|tara:strand:- start:885 stop:1436 length:552 start_codon:yes stop_codon:yes gene_type:complete
MNDNYNIICDKHNIILKKNKENKNFILELMMVNNNIDIKKIITFKIYELMAELNKDIIEKIEIEDTHLEDKKNVLFIFKHICQELGIPKKYMYLETEIISDENCENFKIIGKSIKYNGFIEKSEQVNSHISLLNIALQENNKLNLTYEFNMELDENMPIYMENMFGLLMKKIFYNLNTFIQNI